MARTKPILELSEEQLKRQLETVMRSPSTGQKLVRRARIVGLKRLIAVVREAGHPFGSAGRPPEAQDQERSAPALDRRDRFTRDDI
jgi:hypothetical protein